MKWKKTSLDLLTEVEAPWCVAVELALSVGWKYQDVFLCVFLGEEVGGVFELI